MAVLSVRNLEMTFVERTLFRNVSFDVEQKDKVGFIGAGNMGSAMMASMKSQAELYVYDIAAAACEKAKLEFGAQITKDIQEVVAISDIVFVAIKPQFLDEILKQIKEAWSQEKILASIVAGKTLAFWQEILGEEAQIARIMPNTPAMLGLGMILYATEQVANTEEQAFLL